MAWIRAIGTPASTSPVDLTSYTWDGNLYSDNYLVGQQTKTISMAGKTPRIWTNAVMQANLCSIAKSSGGKVTVEVSEDGVTWSQVLENAAAAGTLVTANLTSYIGKELLVRVIVMNTNPSGQFGGNIKAIYPASGVLMIA